MRTTRILSLSLPPDLIREAERVAKQEGRTKSELFREALRRYVEERRWRGLQRYGSSRARRLGMTEAGSNALSRGSVAAGNVPRVVAHTNIYISALNFAGTADEVLALGRARVIEVFISPPIFEESTFNSPASIKSVVALLPKKREDLALEDVEITKPL